MAQPRADIAASSGAAKIILSGSDLHRVVDRIAHQILEKTSGATGTVLLGIPTRGVPLAHRLAAQSPVALRLLKRANRFMRKPQADRMDKYSSPCATLASNAAW